MIEKFGILTLLCTAGAADTKTAIILISLSILAFACHKLKNNIKNARKAKPLQGK